MSRTSYVLHFTELSIIFTVMTIISSNFSKVLLATVSIIMW